METMDVCPGLIKKRVCSSQEGNRATGILNS